MLFLGIDGEMSSPDLAGGGQLVQIGASVRTPEGLKSIGFLIKPLPDMLWDNEAAKVHCIPEEVLYIYGVNQEDVDDALYNWLIKHGADPKSRAKNIPVGFNITGFDLPFIKKQLPKTFSLLSRRTAELNGMLWLLHSKNNKTFEQWKSEAMRFAEDNLDDYVPHDAEWDAKRHLLCYEYLQSVILGA